MKLAPDQPREIVAKRPDILSVIARPGFLDRFNRRVQRTDECWLWTGGVNADGYGVTAVGAKRHVFRAHRLAYALAYDKDPGSFAVCHSCDNPACVNPAHLWIGTISDNNMDMRLKGRDRTPRGENVATGKLTETDVMEIYASDDSLADLACRFKVSKNAIHKIWAGKSWGWLTGGKRGGHLLASHKVGEVQVNIRIGHLDRMPRCRKCSRAICGCSDAEFAGVIPA